MTFTTLKTGIIISLLLILTATIGFAQIDSLPVRIAGIIYGNDTSENTPFVHIINYRSGKGTISDSSGFFKTTMLKTDSLLFRCLGYEDKVFKLADTLNSTVLFFEIRLAKTSYYIDVIDILALSRLNQFRYDFIKIPLPENQWAQQLIIPGVTKENYKWIHKDERFIPKQTLGGPISGLYNLFSDREESIRKYLELINNEESDREIDEKFNMKLLSEFTGYTGDTLIDFNLYLNFSRMYLLTTDAYHIFSRIKNKIPEFKKDYFTDPLK